jgi:ABC-type Na+ efflux pump permease subunit
VARSDGYSDPRPAIARRDLASLSREKTIVLALLIQLFVAAFSSFLVVGLTSLYDPGSVSSGEVTVGVSGNAAEDLARATSSIDGIDVVRFPSEEGAVAAFESGRLDTVLLANRAPSAQINVEATAPEGSLRTTLIVVQIREVLEEFERQEREERTEYVDNELVPLPPEVEASPYFGFTYTILLPLLLFLPPFISGSVAVDAITEEIERQTLELLRVAPVSLTDIVDGKAIGMILLAPLQAALWILLLGVNGIAVSNALALLVLVTAVATILVVLGLGLGLVTRRRRRAQLLYSVLAILLFGLAVLLPEHPATTVARLAVASATQVTMAHVVGFAVAATVAYAAVRTYADRLNPESLS